MVIMLSALPKPLIALAAATILFGLATPLLKILLSGMAPLVLVALLGFGAGLAVLFWGMVRNTGFSRCTAPAGKRERILFACTVIAGGFIAPVLQNLSLAVTPAATTALLLNFEVVATVIFAFIFFGEPADKRAGLALVLIFAASLILGWNGESVIGFSVGAIGIIVSCVFWGLDNNCMAHITAYSPEKIALFKAVFGGVLAAGVVIILGEPLPDPWLAGIAIFTGFFSYGTGLLLFIFALKEMGAARAGAIYAAAPFIGCVASLVIFSDPLGHNFWLAVPLFGFGAMIIIHDQWAGNGAGLREERA
ncbi:MAG: DMT family transporter [Methanoregula sp.]|jgi:drug/metabolite transporter (DMT)-like permease